MIDIAAYALLKRGISTSGATTSQIVDAEIRDGHLILILDNGSEIDCGALPAAGIDDETITSSTTWSSEKITQYHEENSYDEEEIRTIIKETTDSYNIINGGSANFP